MKPWQWLAIPLSLVLGTLVVAFPLTYDPWEAASGGSQGTIDAGSGYVFSPICRIRDRHKTESTVNELFVLLFMGCVAALCGVIFGYRPRGFPKRRRKMTEACFGFAFLALAAWPWVLMAFQSYSWITVVLTPIHEIGGVILMTLLPVVLSPFLAIGGVILLRAPVTNAPFKLR